MYFVIYHTQYCIYLDSFLTALLFLILNLINYYKYWVDYISSLPFNILLYALSPDILLPIELKKFTTGLMVP
jgi:hypothetical protein